MKIAVIGATGTIGAAVVDLLKAHDHEVVGGSRHAGHRVDIEEPGSVAEFYRHHRDLDAVISTAGSAGVYGSVDQLSDDKLESGIRAKLLGQIRVVREGADKIAPGGVFVLTSGMLAHTPRSATAGVAMINAAVEGFARASQLDLRGGRRIVVVCPPLVRETAESRAKDGGGRPPAHDVARVYLDALESADGGLVRFVPGHEP